MAENLAVSGQVRRLDGSPVPVVTVRAFDKDVRSEELLGEAISQQNGSYRTSYPSDKLPRAEKENADLFMRAFSPDGTVLTESNEVLLKRAGGRNNQPSSPAAQRATIGVTRTNLSGEASPEESL